MESYLDQQSMSSSLPNEEQSVWYKRIFFTWVKPLLTLGATQNITEQNFFELNRSDDPAKCGQQLKSAIENCSHSKHPLLYALFKTNSKILFISLLLGGLHSLSNIGLIILLKSFLYFLQSPTSSLGQGVWLSIGMCVLGVFTWTSIQHCFFYTARMAIRVKGSLSYYFYDRYLQLHPRSSIQMPSGEINNLLMQDSTRVSVAGEALTMTIVSIFIIISAVSLLYQQIGISGAVGIIAALFFIPISNAINNKIWRDSKTLQSISDSRITRMKELLDHIKNIKSLCWGDLIKKLILQVRQSELSTLKNLIWNTALLNLVIQASPMFVASVTFATYALLGKTLDLPTVISVIAIFGILKTPVMHLPRLIIELTDARVSLDRLNAFLKLQTLPDEKCHLDHQEKGNIVFKNAFIGWHEDKSILNDITLEVQSGQLLGLVGASGAGKTTFLIAMLNDSVILGGEYKIHGKISYAPQHPFIISGTIRDNILFGNDYDSERYWRVIHACNLMHDFETFSLFDMTEIIENGVNLSGGQKQRIALARATYHEADIYLFDDSFSALDDRVGDSIFQHAILQLLKGKTRILVTHKNEFISHCDQQLVLRENKICKLDETAGSVNLVRYHASSLPATLDVPADVESDSIKQKVTDEEISEDKINFRLYSYYFAKAGGLVVLGIIFIVFGIREIMSVGSEYWLSYWTAKPMLSNLQIVSGFIVLGVLASVATFYRGLYTLIASTKVAENLHNEMLDCVLKAPMQFFEVNPIGRILNRFSRDIRSIDRELGPRFLDAISVVFVLASAFVIIEMTNTYMIFLMGFIGVFYYRIQSFYRSTAPTINRMEAKAQSPLFSHIHETIDGVVSIKTFGCQNKYISRYYEKLVHSLNATYTQYVIGRWLSVNLDLLGVIMLGIVACVAVLTREYVSWSLAGLSVTYVLMVTVNFQRSVHNLTDLEISMTSLERVHSYTSIAAETQGDCHPASNQCPTLGAIKFENVTLRYHEDSESVLNKVSFEIKPAQKIGVIGRTGSGKSSLINAIFKLHRPQEGTIYVDGLNVDDLSTDILRKRIHLLPQEPLFIAGTLRINLDPYQQFADSELTEAIKAMGCFPFYATLPGGLDFMLKSSGSNLSLGNRQLFSLVRAVLLKPKILLLDEATANVDIQTDKHIQELIRHHFQDATVLTIAHRLETVMQSDLILCMEDGRIVDYDSPAALAEKVNSRVHDYLNKNKNCYA